MTSRIDLIVSYIPKGAVFAEIGSDHGLLSISALLEDPTRKAHLSDNKKGPYQNSLKAIEETGLTSRADVRLADGLDGLPKDTDTVVLAGMGGRLMQRILEKGNDLLGNVKTLVLEPQGGREELLDYLFKLPYRHVAYGMAKEGHHYYECFVLSKGEPQVLDGVTKVYGPLYLEGGDLFVERCKKEEETVRALLEVASGNAQRAEELQQRLNLLREVLKNGNQ